VSPKRRGTSILIQRLSSSRDPRISSCRLSSDINQCYFFLGFPCKVCKVFYSFPLPYMSHPYYPHWYEDSKNLEVLYNISQCALFSHSAQSTEYEDYSFSDVRNSLFNPRMELNIKYIFYILIFKCLDLRYTPCVCVNIYIYIYIYTHTHEYKQTRDQRCPNLICYHLFVK
jgi:hypothetical protein